MTCRFVIGAAVAAGMLAVSTLTAAPGFWQAATQADFLRGEVDQLSIDEHGRLTLGPELATVHDAGVPFVCAVSAPPDLAVDTPACPGVPLVGFLRGDGFNVYSHDGRIDLRDLRGLG